MNSGGGLIPMPDVSPARLYLLPLSTTTLPIPTGKLEMVTGAYLVQMSDGTNVLIDTGLPVDYTPAPGTPSADTQSNVIEQLAALDLQPEDIDILICTHFDPDHAGYNDSF